MLVFRMVEARDWTTAEEYVDARTNARKPALKTSPSKAGNKKKRGKPKNGDDASAATVAS
jgi:hypothetical protein